MGKRSREASENVVEKKLRKIKKLEKKIEKYKVACAAASDPEVASILDENGVVEGGQQDEPEQEDDQENVILEENVEKDNEEPESLPQDIRTALGMSEDNDANYGAELKEEIVNIMDNILTEGLNKEQHESLCKHKIPRNCKLLDAPKLNSEFSGLLNQSMTNRDNLLKDRQQDLGRAMALVSQTIDTLTKKEFDKIQIIKSLSDSIRLLSNLHHQYTQIRRKLIAPFMDKALTQNLSENKRSEFLYSKLEESVKTSSAMKRTMNILKPKNLPKNYQNPRRQKTQHHQATRTNSSNYKPGTYQGNQVQTYRPQRSHPRPAPQARSNRRPTSSHHRGGRAKYL